MHPVENALDRSQSGIVWLRQALLFLRFGLVGLLNTAFGYSIFAGLVLVGLRPGFALAGAAVLGAGSNFYTSQHLVFGRTTRASRFILLYTATLAVNVAALHALEAAHLSALYSQALLALPIAVLSFTGQRLWVFGPTRAGTIAERERRNLIERKCEDFRPPVFKPNSTARHTFENSLRRFLDLQAGTAWTDLKIELRSASGKLLDIGCGAQIYRPLVPIGVIYYGIDTCDARERFGYAISDTHYFAGEEWGVPNGSIDVALCTEVLEHVTEPARLLAQTFRCLRPGGRLVLTVPFAARWHFVPYDYWRYTPSSLQMLLTDAGFEQIMVHARGNPLTVACYKVMALQLMLLFGAEEHQPGPAKRLMGLLLLPVLFAVALLAQMTLVADWGDDCLGYTVTARRAFGSGE